MITRKPRRLRNGPPENITVIITTVAPKNEAQRQRHGRACLALLNLGRSLVSERAS